MRKRSCWRTQENERSNFLSDHSGFKRAICKSSGDYAYAQTRLSWCDKFRNLVRWLIYFCLCCFRNSNVVGLRNRVVKSYLWRHFRWGRHWRQSNIRLKKGRKFLNSWLSYNQVRQMNRYFILIYTFYHKKPSSTMKLTEAWKCTNVYESLEIVWHTDGRSV